MSLVKKLFSKSSSLHSIFNTKKLKVSFRTTSNMSSVIKAKTKKILSVVDNARKRWNCRGRLAVCPCKETALTSPWSIR